MTKYIYSYFSDMNNAVDGIFEVTIPYEHEHDYQQFISSVGCFLDYAREYDNADTFATDFLADSENYLSADYIKKNSQLAIDYSDRGSTLERTLDFIDNTCDGWQYREIRIDNSYNADYNIFVD